MKDTKTCLVGINFHYRFPHASNLPEEYRGRPVQIGNDNEGNITGNGKILTGPALEYASEMIIRINSFGI